jgi:hypothetical protein
MRWKLSLQEYTSDIQNLWTTQSFKRNERTEFLKSSRHGKIDELLHARITNLVDKSEATLSPIQPRSCF